MKAHSPAGEQKNTGHLEPRRLECLGGRQSPGLGGGPVLSGAELKVLLYIVRRTLGFKKDADATSLSQICHGITTKEGRALDRGTGLSRTTAYKAVKQLEALGLITVRRNQTEDGSPTVNVYSLRFRAVGGGVGVAGEGQRDDQDGSGINPGVGQKPTQGGLETDPGVGRKDTPQQTDAQQTEGQQTEDQPPAPPPERASPGQWRAPLTEPDAGGAGGDTGPPPAGKQAPTQETEASPGGLPPPSPEAAAGAIDRLVGFGVWCSRASRLVEALNLTAEVVARAIQALNAEVRRGASFANPAAVLAARLAAGWVPPEVEEPPEDAGEASDDAGVQEPFPPPKPERVPLPPLVDERGRSREAYEWFEQVKRELALQLPRETFDAWLRSATLAGYRPPEGSTPGVLTVRLGSQPAYEWVTHRLHRVIQRLVASMHSGLVRVTYTAPHLPEERPVERRPAVGSAGAGGVYACQQGAFTHVNTRLI